MAETNQCHGEEPAYPRIKAFLPLLSLAKVLLSHPGRNAIYPIHIGISSVHMYGMFVESTLV